MGRPKGTTKAGPRKVQIAFYVEPHERSRFERTAMDAGLTLSDWVRFTLRAAAGMYVGTKEGPMSKSACGKEGMK